MDLKPAGHEFTIIVNGAEFHISAHELTGLQIKNLAQIPVDYELFHVHGSESTAVANEQSIHIHQKEEFRAIPAGTFGA
jgi:hypothetical protein